jgi:hypothetical protein
MFEKIKQYLLTNIELQKLTIIEKVALLIGASAAISIVVIFFMAALFFLSLGLCFYISNLFGNNYSGFLIVGAFYVLLTILAYVLKDKLITKPVINNVVKMIFKKL